MKLNKQTDQSFNCNFVELEKVAVVFQSPQVILKMIFLEIFKHELILKTELDDLEIFD